MTAADIRTRRLVFAAVSLVFFFINGATFTTLGVVLYTMVGELHWSQAAAGFSFTLLGVACGICSPLPTALIRRIGVRGTFVGGALALAAGFALAAVSAGIGLFYVAMLLLGLGFTLVGNIGGVYLLAGWYPEAASRVIGLYLMLGAFGATVGPPLVQAIVAGSGGWRGNWTTMAWASLVLAGVCFAGVREPGGGAAGPPPRAGEGERGATVGGEEARPLGARKEGQDAPGAGDGRRSLRAQERDQDATVDGGNALSRAAEEGRGEGGPVPWHDREALRTPQFRVVAAGMTITMACVTTNSSVTVTHLVKLGATPAFAAIILSVLALVATVWKGIAGRLCERLPVPRLLAGGLATQAVGNLLLGTASTAALQIAAAVVYGTGWGVCYVAGTVILLQYFGRDAGSRALGTVWLITTLAAAGPLVAGAIADRYGTFGPIFYVYAVLLVVIAVPTFRLRAPVPAPAVT